MLEKLLSMESNSIYIPRLILSQVARGTLHTWVVILIAPEVLGMELMPNEKSVVWSIGVVCYTILCGFNPFSHTNDDESKYLFTTGKFDFDPLFWNGKLALGKHFKQDTLKVDPSSPLTLKECLESPFITSRWEAGQFVSIYS